MRARRVRWSASHRPTCRRGASGTSAFSANSSAKACGRACSTSCTAWPHLPRCSKPASRTRLRDAAHRRHTAIIMSMHPFDKAIALHHSDIRVGHFTGATSPDYWNMVGPFGGATAAIALQSVLQHPDLLGTPLALTVNFAAALEAGAFDVQATAVRTNRSTQHWTVQIT